MKLLQQTEEKLYKQTLTNMWDSSAALQRYFDDGARIFRNAVHEVQTTRSPPPETVKSKIFFIKSF